MRVFVRRFLVLMLLGLLATHIAAQDDTFIPNSELLEKAARNGSVPVLVSFNIPNYQTDSVLPSSQQFIQRTAIAATQSRIVQDTAAIDTATIAVNSTYDTLPLLALEVDVPALLALQNNPSILSIVEDRADPVLLDSTMAVVGATDANGPHAFGYDGSGWAIAILDTGVMAEHPMFSDGGGGNRVIAQACFNTTSGGNNSLSRCPNGMDTDTASPNAGQDCTQDVASGCEHGTHVAGIAAGNNNGNGGTQYTGVAPDADIIAINVFSLFTSDADNCDDPFCVSAYVSDQIEALEYLYLLSNSLGFNIASVNMSLGGGNNASTCDVDQAARKTAIDNLLTENIVTVIASGNDGFRNATAAPGCISTAITVSSTTDADDVSGFSNVAPWVDFYAPGSSVVSSTVRELGSQPHEYESKGGTSMATPHVAGAYAVMREMYPTWTLAQITTALQNNGVLVDDNRIGGVIDDIPRLLLNGDIVPNVAPIAVDDEATTDEDVPVDIDVLANDTDANLDDLSVDSFTPASNGALVLNANDTFTYTPFPNYNGSDSFTYTMTDGRGEFDTATVDITIIPVNDPPVISIASNPLVVDEGSLAMNVITITDVDDPIASTSTTLGSLVYDSGDNWDWSFQTVDESDSQLVGISATDDYGDTTNASFLLTVNNVAPIIAPLSDITDRPGHHWFSFSFTDPGLNDTHRATINFGEGNSSFEVEIDAYAGGGSFDARNTFNGPGIYTVTVCVTDFTDTSCESFIFTAEAGQSGNTGENGKGNGNNKQ